MQLPCDRDGPLVALAFKLEEGRFGQLTYMRIYSGTVHKGDQVVNMATGKRIKVLTLVRGTQGWWEWIGGREVARASRTMGISSLCRGSTEHMEAEIALRMSFEWGIGARN